MRSLLLIMLAWSATAQAETVTIDFEEFTSYTLVSNTSFESQGYILSVAGGGSVHGHHTWDLALSGQGSVFSMEKQDGGLFSLQQFELYELLANIGPEAGSVAVQIVGYQSGGGQVTSNLLESNAFSLIELSGFNNLESIEFTLTGNLSPVAHFDNFIIAAAVPVPPAVLLFGSALAGLGWVRRKRIV
jgi:hypothetical protein